METNALFIKASRLKLRFQTKRGSITVEDLWDLPLTSNTGKVNLDELAIEAHSKIEQTSTVSFVNNTVKSDNTAELQLEILKYVIAAKQAENKVRLEAAARAEEKQKLLGILSRKQDAAKENMSEQELIELINKL